MAYQTLIKANGIEKFLVYDNSPEVCADRKDWPSGVLYVHDGSNSGLSKAYNLAASKAQELNYSKLLILDQDTYFAPNAWEVYNAQADFEGLAAPMVRTEAGMILSPVDIRGWKKQLLREIEPCDLSLYDYAVINSGCLIPLDLFSKCGGYAETVSLDFSDFQFQLRARKVNSALRIIDTTAIQDFSNDCTDARKLLARYDKYIACAKNFETDNGKDRLKHILEVLRHTLSLTLRTKDGRFLWRFMRHFIFTA